MSTDQQKPSPRPAPKPQRVFRLHTEGNLAYTSTSTNTRYFTNLVDLRIAVLNAHMEILEDKRTSARADDGGELHIQSKAAGRWRRLFRLDRGEDPEAKYPRATKICWVQQFVNGEWIDLAPVFTDPSVDLVGVR